MAKIFDLRVKPWLMSVIEDRRPAAMVSWPESEYKRKSIDLKLEVRNRSETGEKVGQKCRTLVPFATL